MGRGGKEGSGQKIQGERQQLQKEERHIHGVTAEVGLGAEPHPSQTPYFGLDSSASNEGEHKTAPLPFPRPLHPTSLSQVPPPLQCLACTYPAACPPPSPGFGSRSDKQLRRTIL